MMENFEVINNFLVKEIYVTVKVKIVYKDEMVIEGKVQNYREN